MLGKILITMGILKRLFLSVYHYLNFCITSHNKQSYIFLIALASPKSLFLRPALDNMASEKKIIRLNMPSLN